MLLARETIELFTTTLKSLPVRLWSQEFLRGAIYFEIRPSLANTFIYFFLMYRLGVRSSGSRPKGGGMTMEI